MALSGKIQVALEAVMVYGLVILIVMLSIGTLAHFGVLDLSRYLPDRCDISTFRCEAFTVSASNGIQFDLRNTFGKSLQELNVSLNNEDGSANCIYTEQNYNSVAISAANPLPNGMLAQPVPLQQASGKCTTNVTPGKKLNARISVKFIPAGTSLEQVRSGSVSVTVVE